jgi:hypothetical protein
MKEARRTADKGCISYYMRPNPFGGHNLWSDELLALWDEIERIGKPISTHESASSAVSGFGDRMDTHVSGHILPHPSEAMARLPVSSGMASWRSSPGST